MTINQTKHRRRHRTLHASLDELLSDFIRAGSSFRGKHNLHSSVLDLAAWSSEQKERPEISSLVNEIHSFTQEEEGDTNGL